MDLILSLASAANTANPALLVLRMKGYQLSIKSIDDEFCIYVARKERRQFVGNSACEVLGLVSLWEHLGDNWMEKIPSIPDIVSEIIVRETDQELGADMD